MWQTKMPRLKRRWGKCAYILARHAQRGGFGVKNSPLTARKTEEPVDGCNHRRYARSGSHPRGHSRLIQMEKTESRSGPRAGKRRGKRRRRRRFKLCLKNTKKPAIQCSLFASLILLIYKHIYKTLWFLRPHFHKNLFIKNNRRNSYYQ